MLQHQKEKLKIYVIGEELSAENVRQLYLFAGEKVQIEVICRDNPYKNIKREHRSGQTTFMKFLIADVVPEDKILYLDGDTIVTSDVAEFYYTDLTNHYAAVIRDLVAEIEHQDHKRLGLKSYFNAGIILLNLKKIRDDNIRQKLVDYAIHDKQYMYLDQDAFNVVFDENVVYMDYKWNYFNIYETKNYTEITKNREKKIVHFAGCRPWLSLEYPLTELWLKYVSPEDIGEVLKSYLIQHAEVIRKCLAFQDTSGNKTFLQQNMSLEKRVENLEKRPRFVWRFYEFISDGNKTTLYILGIPFFKRKHHTIYILGLPLLKIK